MNVLWIYNRPLVPEAGGTERITSLIMKGLECCGHNCLGILVFDQQTFGMSYNRCVVEDLSMFLESYHVDVVINQIAYETGLINAFLQNGGQEWRDKGGKLISCLHFDPKQPSLYFLFRIKRNKSLKDWITLLKLTLLYGYYERKKDMKFGHVYREIYDKSDYFVALSERHFPYLKKVMRLDDYGKLLAISNPLTFDDISDVSVLNEKKNVAIVVARMLEYHKRVSLVLKAWKRLDKSVSDKWKLKIIGDGPDIQQYKDFVVKNKMTNVNFEGRQNPEPYYREAKIYLMTSSAEGWGLTLTESLQRGVVPIAMDSSPVFHDIIDDGKDGFITPNGDVKVFAEKMQWLMLNGEEWHIMACNALKCAHDFDIDHIIRKWKRMLNQ